MMKSKKIKKSISKSALLPSQVRFYMNIEGIRMGVPVEGLWRNFSRKILSIENIDEIVISSNDLTLVIDYKMKSKTIQKHKSGGFSRRDILTYIASSYPSNATDIILNGIKLKSNKYYLMADS